MLLRLIKNGQIEIGAAYTDRLENYHDGESMLRNAVYGKKILHELLSISTDICYHPDLPGLSEQTPDVYKRQYHMTATAANKNVLCEIGHTNYFMWDNLPNRNDSIIMIHQMIAYFNGDVFI